MIDAFTTAVAFLQLHGYVIMYLIMVAEGPVVTSAAGFLASLGYFNFFIVLGLSFLGDLTGDLIYYFIGYFAREKVINRYGRYVGLNKKLIRKIEKNLRKHSTKAIVMIKLTPVLASAGLILVGASKIPFRKFLLVSILTIIPSAIFFTCTGYFFGVAFETANRYFNLGRWIIVVGILAFILFSVIIKKVYSKMMRKIEGFK